MSHLLDEYHQLSSDWRGVLSQFISGDHLDALDQMVSEERSKGEVYPPIGEVWTALRLCPLKETRVVILGQDPYHGAGQAHGLSFSVRAGVKIPPSLRNIYKELEADMGCVPCESGELTAWAQQGVLLLNTVFTVNAGDANSHQKKGWEQVTDALIQAVSELNEHVVFILWGRPAQKKRDLIAERHSVIESAHPSPLSARNGFLGSRPFSKTNQALSSHGQAEIEWSLNP